MPIYGAYEPHVDAGTVASLQTTFARSRLSHTSWKSRRLEGRVDGRNVFRYDAKGAVDIFRDRRGTSPTKVNLWLLVDASGSMNGEKARSACDISATLVSAFERSPQVRLHIWQHDYQYSPAETRLYRIFEPGMTRERIGRMPKNGLQGNADGFALLAIGERALAHARPDEKTIIVVISDGEPTDHGRGATNTDLIQHSHTISENLRARGAQVLCVAIEHGTSYAYGMYGKDNVVPFAYGVPGRWEKLAGSLASILGKALQERPR